MLLRVHLFLNVRSKLTFEPGILNCLICFIILGKSHIVVYITVLQIMIIKTSDCFQCGTYSQQGGNLIVMEGNSKMDSTGV